MSNIDKFVSCINVQRLKKYREKLLNLSYPLPEKKIIIRYILPENNFLMTGNPYKIYFQNH